MSRTFDSLRAGIELGQALTQPYLRKKERDEDYARKKEAFAEEIQLRQAMQQAELEQRAQLQREEFALRRALMERGAALREASRLSQAAEQQAAFEQALPANVDVGIAPPGASIQSVAPVATQPTKPFLKPTGDLNPIDVEMDQSGNLKFKGKANTPEDLKRMVEMRNQFLGNQSLNPQAVTPVATPTFVPSGSAPVSGAKRPVDPKVNALYGASIF